MNRKTQILRLIREKGPLTTGQVSAELLLDRANTSAHLNTLVSAGQLMKAQIGRLVYYSTDGAVPDNASDTHPMSRNREILAYVIKNGPITTNQVMAELGLDRANTSAYLNGLVKHGDLRKAQIGRNVFYSQDGSTPVIARHITSLSNKLVMVMDEGSTERRCSRCGFYPQTGGLYCTMCGGSLDRSRNRTIPTEVKQAVWKRDGGRCVLCGAAENLHYDHIIPFSKGGGSTIENVQILCAECNMRKSDQIE